MYSDDIKNSIGKNKRKKWECNKKFCQHKKQTFSNKKIELFSVQENRLSAQNWKPVFKDL